MPSKDQTRLDVDGILCISLKEREDRRKIQEVITIQLNADIEYLLVDRDLEDSQRGCYTSHQACARLMLERGWKRALILEDDAVISRNPAKAFKNINKFINDHDPAVFYLGVLLGKLWPTFYPGVAGCRAQGTHAYIINQSAAKLITSEPYTGLEIDTLLKKRLPGFTAFPFIFQQLPESIGKSDLKDARGEIGGNKTEKYWSRNNRKQYMEWIRNFYMIRKI